MRLQWLELTDFRCYAKLRWSPDPGFNILVGNNGAGKSSVVEAIGYLGKLRSFRRVADAALVRQGASTAVVRGSFDTGDVETVVEIEVPESGARRVRLNAKRPKRLRDVGARVPVVTFDPEDLTLVKGPPGERRRYLDDVAAQLWPVAAAEQDDYEKAVRQRNALLREQGPSTPDPELDAWDDQVAGTGAKLTVRRLALLDDLGPVLRDVYREVAATGTIVAVYSSPAWSVVPEDEAAVRAALAARLAERRWLDKERRVTTSGPHRDEPGFGLEGRDLRSMASQGEQRTAALALRLAAYDLIRDRAGTTPVLILDDVFSELDGERAAAVVRRLPGGQVFASTARGTEVPPGGRLWKVGDGRVEAA